MTRLTSLQTCAVQCLSLFRLVQDDCECIENAPHVHSQTRFSCADTDTHVYRAVDLSPMSNLDVATTAIKPNAWSDFPIFGLESLYLTTFESIVLLYRNDRRPLYGYFDGKGGMHGSMRGKDWQQYKSRVFVKVPAHSYYKSQFRSQSRDNSTYK